MKYRKLRIAWSVGSGVFCLLLIVLWVRSYSWADNFSYEGGAVTRSAVSHNGVLFVGELYNNKGGGWKVSSRPITEPVSMWQQLAVAYFDERPRDVLVAFPHWLLLLPLASLTIVPWLSWHFRIRTLLIITAAVAALLGLVTWASR